MKNKNFIFIFIIAILVLFVVQQQDKKTAILPVLDGDFKIYSMELNYVGGFDPLINLEKYAGQLLTVNVGVIEKASQWATISSMYVETGIYAIEDEPWLQSFLDLKQGKKGDVVTLQPGCIEGESNVQNYKVTLKGWAYGGEIIHPKLRLPANLGGKHYFLFSEAFRQCASQGDPGVSDWEIKDLGILGDPCPSGTKPCPDGSCKASCGGCTNQCTNGAKECSTENSYKLCKDFNQDSCTEWGTADECAPSTPYCNKGECSSVECKTTNTQFGVTCNTGDVYYKDNCGKIQSMKEDCKSGFTCRDGLCVEGSNNNNGECEFYQDPDDCSKVAMWVYIAGGVFLFFMFMMMMR